MRVTSTPPTGKFSININGKQRTGSMSMKSLCTLERELGFSIIQALRDPTRYWGFDTIATVLWVALNAENPRITKEHVQLWMQTHLEEGGTLEDYITASQQAVFTGMGKQVRIGDQVKKIKAGELADVDGPVEGVEDEAANEEGGEEHAPLEDVDAPPQKKRRSA